MLSDVGKLETALVDLSVERKPFINDGRAAGGRVNTRRDGHLAYCSDEE